MGYVGLGCGTNQITRESGQEADSVGDLWAYPCGTEVADGLHEG